MRQHILIFLHILIICDAHLRKYSQRTMLKAHIFHHKRTTSTTLQTDHLSSPGTNETQLTTEKPRGIINLEEEHKGRYEYANSDYLFENSQLCNKTSPDIFIWVHTAPKNFRRRLALRLTWGNPKLNLLHLNRKTTMAFFMGAVANVSLQNLLDYEQETYGDIVQGDYLDHYRNLTYKAIQATRWITENCHQAQLVIKADDDALVDVVQFLKIIKSLEKPDKITKLDNTIICK